MARPPGAPGPSGPGRAPGMGAGFTEGGRWTDKGSRRRRLGLAGSLAAGGRRPRPAALALGTHGAGRRRSAVPPHPPPAVPAVTHPGDRACQSGWAVLHAPGILSPRKFAVKGATACGLRVPPLRSGQTPDSELPRQDPAPAGRTGKNRPTTKTRPGHRRGRLRPRPPRPGHRILDSRYFFSRSNPTSRAPSATWPRNFIRRRLAADRFSVGAS
jgi:hypothetical protein